MGVGGLFDFYSGNIPRAPKWLREIGMEWSFRLVMEPDACFTVILLVIPYSCCAFSLATKIKDKQAAALPAPENQDKDDK